MDPVKTNVIIDQDLCIGCGSCVDDCVAHNIELVNTAIDWDESPAENPSAEVAGELHHPILKARVKSLCFKCGHCVAICPVGAPSLPCYADEAIPYDPETFKLSTQNVINAIKFRRSIRDFKQEPISMEHLHLMLDAAGHTPTAVNRQMCRFSFLQDSMADFKAMIWESLEDVFAHDQQMPIPRETLQSFLERRAKNSADDYLFKNAPALLLIEAPDALDAGLAAAAVEMVATTLGIGVLYNGYLRRVIEQTPAAREYFDMGDERKLYACMLLGYQKQQYHRSAPRRFPSVVLR